MDTFNILEKMYMNRIIKIKEINRFKQKLKAHQKTYD